MVVVESIYQLFKSTPFFSDGVPTSHRNRSTTSTQNSTFIKRWLYWLTVLKTRDMNKEMNIFLWSTHSRHTVGIKRRQFYERKSHKIRKTLHLLVDTLDQASLRQTCFSWFHLLSRCYLTLHHSQNIFIIWELEYIFFHWYFWLFFWISTVFIVDQEFLKKVFFPLFLTSIMIDEI